MSAHRDFKAKLVKAKRPLREGTRLLDRASKWSVDEDVLDTLREIEGLTVLAQECYRSGRALDRWAIELWLYEHGYKRPPSEHG